MNVTVRRVTARDDSLLPKLRALLADSVDNGASVGFLAPLRRESADGYWEGVLACLGEGRLLWVAEDGGEIIGTVQIDPCAKENGRHRAELQKLLVHSAHRGRGIAQQLMDEAEKFARAQGFTLLVLDSEEGSVAERWYGRLGWTRVGSIPGYAGKLSGELIATVYYYKNL